MRAMIGSKAESVGIPIIFFSILYALGRGVEFDEGTELLFVRRLRSGIFNSTRRGAAAEFLARFGASVASGTPGSGSLKIFEPACDRSLECGRKRVTSVQHLLIAVH